MVSVRTVCGLWCLSGLSVDCGVCQDHLLTVVSVRTVCGPILWCLLGLSVDCGVCQDCLWTVVYVRTICGLWCLSGLSVDCGVCHDYLWTVVSVTTICGQWYLSGLSVDWVVWMKPALNLILFFIEIPRLTTGKEDTFMTDSCSETQQANWNMHQSNQLAQIKTNEP